jgi:hypothetical protein
MNLLNSAYKEMTAIKDQKAGMKPRYESSLLKPFIPDSSGLNPIQKFSEKLSEIVMKRPINTMPVRPPPFEVDRGRKMPSFGYRPLIHHKMDV